MSRAWGQTLNYQREREADSKERERLRLTSGHVATDGFNSRIKMIENHIEDMACVTAPWLVEMRDSLEKSLSRKLRQKIYVAQFGDRVKVGTSVEVDVRLAHFAKKLGEQADIIAVFDGDEGIEGRIHTRFKKYLVQKREWFKADPVGKIIRGYSLPDQLDQLIHGDAWPDVLLLDWYKKYGTHKEHNDARRKVNRIYSSRDPS